MLSFDAEVLSLLFAQMNRALWPGQLVFGAAALLTAWLVISGRRVATRVAGAVLVAAWLCSGLVFHLHYFAGLSFTAPAYGGLFLLQAALLAWYLLVRGRPVLAFQPGLAAWAGLLAMAYALIVVPELALLGGELATARSFGLAPGPTAVFTLGLLLVGRGRCPLHLLLLPAIWCVIAGATAWTLSIPEDLASPFIAVLLLAVAIRHNMIRSNESRFR